jgi:hypothetical protein
MVAMLQKHRRLLTLEPLEDRTVPTGFATAVQDPITGIIFLTMDGNSPGIMVNKGTSTQFGANTLQVAPTDSFTTLNGVSNPANFSLPSVSSIDLTAGNGSNSILFGNLNGFAIPGNIDIETGNGTNVVTLGGATGKKVNNGIQTPTGLITFNGTHGLSTGTDTINMTNVLAGGSQITPGRGPLTVNQSNVTLGFDLIFAARSQFGSDNISIKNSTFSPPPSTVAIGQLVITDGNANNSFFLDTISVGPATITSGNGNNRLTFSHSSILTDTTILGTESVVANGNNTVVMDTDTISGQSLDLSILDQSGVSGVLQGGSPGVQFTMNNVAPSPDVGHRNPRHISHVTLNAITFTTAFPAATPQLSIRMDDGDYYYDTQRGNALNTGSPNLSGSTFVATAVDLPGLASITLGDHFSLVQLGQLGSVTDGIPAGTDSADVDAGELQLSAENDLDTVILAADVTGELIPSPTSTAPFILPATESVNLGDNTINPVQGTPFPASSSNKQLPPPSVFTSGVVGTSTVQGNMAFEIGNNLSVPGFVNGFSAGEPLGWPVKMTETVIGSVASGFFGAPALPTGNLNFTPTTLAKLEGGLNNGIVSPGGADDGLALLIDPSSFGGDLNIIQGSGGFLHRESLVLNNVTAGNIFAQLASDGSEVPDGNKNLGVYIGMDHVVVTDNQFGDIFTGSPPGLTLADIGHGADTVYLGVIPKQTALSTSVFGFAGSDKNRGPQPSDFLTVAGELFVTLSDSGINGLEAHNTTCASGIISGFGIGGVALPGFPAFNVFVDDGGNSGFVVENFANHP